MTRKSMWVGTLVFLAVAVWGCGGGGLEADAVSTSPPPTTTPTTVSASVEPDPTTTLADTAPSPLTDPCSLLAVADIEEVTGQAFDEGASNEDLSSDVILVCDWFGTGDFALVQVLVSSTAGLEEERAIAEEIYAVTDVEIPGATAAYIAEGSVVGMEVSGTFLQVAYLPSSSDDVSAATLALAELAVANLAD